MLAFHCSWRSISEDNHPYFFPTTKFRARIPHDDWENFRYAAWDYHHGRGLLADEAMIVSTPIPSRDSEQRHSIRYCMDLVMLEHGNGEHHLRHDISTPVFLTRAAEAEDGGHGFGGFLSWLFNAGAAHAAEEKPLSRDWDAHEFGARTTVPFARLQGAKKYKVSDVRFLDRRALGGGGARVTGPEDPLFEGAALRPGEVYTRSQLLRELEALSSCGMFDGVKVEAVRPQPDGTLGLTVSYAETLCPPAKRFSCVNVGGLLPAQADEVDDDDMTEREKIALDPAEA
ncbi:hypothetical protein ZWY2020_052640 [Hordeum vulgare]|nr:hypothetical protein ZWY2020_052640 [Hordeum vulgare]